jgi:hypothetical protein
MDERFAAVCAGHGGAPRRTRSGGAAGVSALARGGLPFAAPLIALILGFLVTRGTPATLALEGLVLAGIALAARAKPGAATVLALAVMALPYTWAPDLPKMGAGFGLVVGLLLLVAFLPGISGFRVNALDLAVVAFAVTPALISFLQGQPFHATQWIAPATLFPYLGFRVLFTDGRARSAFAPSMIVAGVLVGLVGVWESIVGRNPIVAAAAPRYTDTGYVTTWNIPLHRAGHLRAESTFGHPIAFGMFLLIPLAFALARPGRRYLVAAGVILAACAVTYSRGPWLAACVVIALMVGWGRVRVTLSALVAGAAAVAIGPVRQVILESGQSTTEAGHNASYRLGLLGEALHHLTFLGHPFADLQTSIPNFPDVASLLAATIIQTGAVGVLELGVIALLAVHGLRRARAGRDADRRAAAVALVASLVGLLSVTLITSYQFFFWALVAYVAQAAHGGVASIGLPPRLAEEQTTR